MLRGEETSVMYDVYLVNAVKNLPDMLSTLAPPPAPPCIYCSHTGALDKPGPVSLIMNLLLKIDTPT